MQKRLSQPLQLGRNGGEARYCGDWTYSLHGPLLRGRLGRRVAAVASRVALLPLEHAHRRERAVDGDSPGPLLHVLLPLARV